MQDVKTQHENMVAWLGKSGNDILARLTPLKVHCWHMASCIPSEAGELFDAIKKWIIYNQPINRKNIIEKLGDLEFYMEGLRAKLNITRDETLQANIDKLSKQYPDLTYSDAAAAKERADKT